MYFATVSLSTRCPSFDNSLAIRRRLQVGFSRAIRTMSATISPASGGRPIGFDLLAQNRAKPRRCHAITVAGFTIASASAQRDHVRERTTQNARSNGRRRGRGVACRRIASCWRRARFSRTRLARGRKAARQGAEGGLKQSLHRAQARASGRRCHQRIASAVPVSWPQARACDTPANAFLVTTGGWPTTPNVHALRAGRAYPRRETVIGRASRASRTQVHGYLEPGVPGSRRASQGRPVALVALAEGVVAVHHGRLPHLHQPEMAKSLGVVEVV
jgi:hypothetical protein